MRVVESCTFFLYFRGYSADKILENVECEIMNILVEEARESYKAEIIKELRADTTDDMEDNVDIISSTIADWKLNKDSQMSE